MIEANLGDIGCWLDSVPPPKNIFGSFHDWSPATPAPNYNLDLGSGDIWNNF